MMYDNFYDNWIKRSAAVISLWDNVVDGYTPLLESIVNNSLQELNKLLYFSSNCLLKNIDKDNKEKLTEIKLTTAELNLIRQEVQDWKNEFTQYPFKYYITKLSSNGGTCFMCNKSLSSGSGFCISLKFYYGELDLWVEEYKTRAVGPTCLNTLIKKYDIPLNKD